MRHLLAGRMCGTKIGGSFNTIVVCECGLSFIGDSRQIADDRFRAHRDVGGVGGATVPAHHKGQDLPEGTGMLNKLKTVVLALAARS